MENVQKTPVLEPFEMQEAIREFQKAILYMNLRIEALEEDLEELKPKDFPEDDDDEENIEPVS